VNATDEITGYIDAVRAALADLPDGVRAELTDDLAEHLGEVLADGDGTLEDRLGTPQAYAAELRAAAGVVGGFPDPPAPDRWARLRQTVRTNLAAADVRVGPLLGYPTAGEFLRLLRPAWWVLRGYLAAMVLAAVLDDSGQPTGLLPRIGGSEAVAVLLLAACILGSVWLGRRPAPRAPLPRYALHAATVVLILVAVGGFANADSSSRGSAYEDVRYDNPYGGIQDVFVYDAQGRLLTGVRLFDQDGAPIRLGNGWCEGGRFEEGGMGAGTYPRCPENAPYRVPEEASPSVSPSVSTVPTPSGLPPAIPSPAVKSPSPSVMLSSALPRPLPTFS
jgi:hypothetical protein